MLSMVTFIFMAKVMSTESLIFWTMLIFFSNYFSMSNVSYDMISHFPSENTMEDLVSNMMIMLVNLVMLCIFLISYKSSLSVSWLFMKNILFGMVMSVMVFSASKLLNFYICFELSLIPTILIILGWGYQPERLSASKYMLFYTMVGAFPLVILLLWALSKACVDLYQLNYFMMFLGSHGSMGVVSLFASAGFLVKLPLFLLHAWLPMAHVEAPVEGSMFLAAILLKLGVCGMFRLTVFLFLSKFMKFCLILALISLIWVGMVCFQSMDYKMIIAYSSISHMAVGLSSLLSNLKLGMSACLFIMFMHGVSSSFMFMSSYLLYSRSSSRSLLLNKNISSWCMVYTMFWLMACVSMLSAPPSANFIGEVVGSLVILSYVFWSSILLILGSFLTSLYSMSLFMVIFSKNTLSSFKNMSPLNSLEFLSCFTHMWGLLMLWFMAPMFF